jgi:hypothetical protein
MCRRHRQRKGFRRPRDRQSASEREQMSIRSNHRPSCHSRPLGRAEWRKHR